MTQQDEIVEMARQACPYTSEKLRGAFYDGFVSASKLVAAKERERLAQEARDCGGVLTVGAILARGEA